MIDEKNNGIEVLAPAGNPDSLRAAVINGADAVYLGASVFSARAKAGNFTQEQLIEAVRYCHLFGVKVYLAVNTIIKPEEYKDALITVKHAVCAKVDAIIVQDLAFLSILHSTMPDIIVHLSTQAGVHNVYGAIVAERLGAKRVILSRETLIEDIREIRQSTNLEIECFVHGALCVAFSGNCYFSSLATGLSGNRGKCLQFCRKKYSAGSREGYFLSAKDINQSDRIKDLIGAGVTSLKIEGRMRRAEYVGEAVRHYKALLSGIADSGRDLNTLFNRGNGCHAYLDNPTENVIYPNIQGHIGVKAGVVKSVKWKTAELKLDSPLHAGDGIKFIRNGSECGGASIVADGYKTGFAGDVKVGDAVHITSDKKVLDKINARTRKIPVAVSFSCALNQPVEVFAMTDRGNAVTVRSDFIVESAKNAPIDVAAIKDCFDKTGETEFVLSEFCCDLPDGVFIVKSALNALRRNVYDSLTDKILSCYEVKNGLLHIDENTTGCYNSLIEYADAFAKTVENKFALIKSVLPSTGDPGNYKYSLSDEKVVFKSDDGDFLLASAENYDAAIYSPGEYDIDVVKTIEKIESATGKRVYLDLPIMLRGKDIDTIDDILSGQAVNNVIINNIGELELCKNKNCILGSAMNIVNPDFPARKIMSVEYDGKNFGDNYAYVFGKYPIMTFSHCPKKTLNGGNCLHCNREPITITDKTNDFDVVFYKVGFCYSRLLNCIPTCAFDLCQKYNIRRKVVDFVGMTHASRGQIIWALKNAEKPSFPTTGSYFSKKLD